jgi:hypothetical protein
MPKRQETDWRCTPPPATPLQRSAFLDVCTKYLTENATPPTSLSSFDPRSTSHFPVEDPVDVRPATTFTLLESMLYSHKRCMVCSSTKAVVCEHSNPYSLRSYVSLCHLCQTEWNSANMVWRQ